MARHSEKTDDWYRERLRSLVKKAESGCWEYQGYRHPKGYGGMAYRGKGWRTHRLSYYLFKGPIPDGMLVCHTCDVRHCINPNHLFLGTIETNNKDMVAKGRYAWDPKVYTHCKQGHEFNAENTWVCKNGFRHCRRCNLIKQRLKMGWTREQAETLPTTPMGLRPVHPRPPKVTT
jgi:hypothetical protein